MYGELQRWDRDRQTPITRRRRRGRRGGATAAFVPAMPLLGHFVKTVPRVAAPAWGRGVDIFDAGLFRYSLIPARSSRNAYSRAVSR